MIFVKKLFPRWSSSTLPSVPDHHINPHVSDPHTAHTLTEDVIAGMSLAEIINLIDRLPETMTVGTVSNFYRRLMHIAYHSHGTASDDRTLAARIAESLRKALEDSPSGDPTQLAAIRRAIQGTERHARECGYGSLPWLLEEHKVLASDYTLFMIKPEHAHLLKPFLKAVDPDTLSKILPSLVIELIHERRTTKSDSSVMVLHGLACARDSVTEALFDDVDLSALRAAHRDYVSARNVLVKFGLLPERSVSRGFEPEPTRELLAEGIALALREEWQTIKENEPELLAYIAGLDERWCTCFLGALFHLCCHLALANIAGVYGEATRSALEIDLPDKISRVQGLWWDEVDKDAWGAWVKDVTIAERMGLEKSPKGADYTIFYWMLYGLTPELEPEFVGRESDFVRGVALLTRMRIRFQSRLRFELRCLSVGYALARAGTAHRVQDIRNSGSENRDNSFWEDIIT